MSQTAISISSPVAVSDRAVSDRSKRAGGWTRPLSPIGWAVGLAILSPLFPVIGLMHLLSWLERQNGVPGVPQANLLGASGAVAFGDCRESVT